MVHFLTAILGWVKICSPQWVNFYLPFARAFVPFPVWKWHPKSDPFLSKTAIKK
jgi:hypothetical protein